MIEGVRVGVGDFVVVDVGMEGVGVCVVFSGLTNRSLQAYPLDMCIYYKIEPGIKSLS